MSFFLVLGFSRGLTQYYGSTFAMTFKFSRISQTNLETSVEYLQRHFLKHPARSFFLEQTTDRQLDLLLWVLRCLKRLPESPQNKICYRLQLKHTPFSYFPIICSYSIRKCLFLQNRSYASFYILREADWMLFQASAGSFYYVPTILLYISWKYKYWCIQKGLCGVAQPLIM